MPRRALRKIDPALKLENYLFEPMQLPQPWRQTPLFERDAPLEIEVGSGKGLFITSTAQARPEHNFLGIELAERYAEHCAARLARKSLPNARMVSGDALRVFSEILPSACAAAVHIYFPDPWWKSRHRKRRVMNGQLVADIFRVLKPGGILHFWTDVEEYFHSTLDLIQATSKFDGPLPVPELDPQHDLDFRTHFERRMRLHGEAVYRSEFRKPAE
jgi:tRNA (guanine-N7-)-methyltransferase